MKLKLTRFSDGDIVSFSLAHVLSDAGRAMRLMQRLSEHYRALWVGRDLTSPPLSTSSGIFASPQRLAAALERPPTDWQPRPLDAHLSARQWLGLPWKLLRHGTAQYDVHHIYLPLEAVQGIKDLTTAHSVHAACLLLWHSCLELPDAAAGRLGHRGLLHLRAAWCSPSEQLGENDEEQLVAADCWPPAVPIACTASGSQFSPHLMPVSDDPRPFWLAFCRHTGRRAEAEHHGRTAGLHSDAGQLRQEQQQPAVPGASGERPAHSQRRLCTPWPGPSRQRGGGPDRPLWQCSADAQTAGVPARRRWVGRVGVVASCGSRWCPLRAMGGALVWWLHRLLDTSLTPFPACVLVLPDCGASSLPSHAGHEYQGSRPSTPAFYGRALAANAALIRRAILDFRSSPNAALDALHEQVQIVGAPKLKVAAVFVGKSDEKIASTSSITAFPFDQVGASIPTRRVGGC